MTPPIPQLQPPSNHQIGPQQGPTVHMSPGQTTAGRHIPPQQGTSSQIPQQAPPPTQIGLPPIPQGHMGPSSVPVASGSLVPGAVVGLPPQIGSQQSSTLPGTQGSSIPAHVSNTTISSQPSGVIQVPAGASSGPVPAASQTLPGPQTSGVPTMQGMAQISAAQSMPFQPTPSVPTTTNETPQNAEDIKPRTAELISFD